MKSINNYKNGMHVNSKYWREYKKNMPDISDILRDIAVGTLLGDACMYMNVSGLCKIKFEQGSVHKEYLFYLFQLFRDYVFLEFPYERMVGDYIKSYSFKTFEHISFVELWNLFYDEQKHKIIKPGLIMNYLTPIGLAFWIMDDGSLQKDKRTMILHTQGYTYEENLILSDELYKKFNLDNKVIPHKKKYFVIQINSKCSNTLRDLIAPHLHESMLYKLPKKV